MPIEREELMGIARVLLISDTHLSQRVVPQGAPWAVLARQVDLIVHAGDLVNPALIDALADLAPVRAVCGNNDPPDPRLPEARLLLLGAGLRLGVSHGHLGSARSTWQRAWARFANTDANLVVFGHSHEPYDARVGGMRLVNPGSCTRPRGGHAPSVALLQVANGEVNWSSW